jgi:hypothetical protein
MISLPSDTSAHIAPFAHFTGSFFVFFNQKGACLCHAHDLNAQKLEAFHC